MICSHDIGYGPCEICRLHSGLAAVKAERDEARKQVARMIERGDTLAASVAKLERNLAAATRRAEEARDLALEEAARECDRLEQTHNEAAEAWIADDDEDRASRCSLRAAAVRGAAMVIRALQPQAPDAERGGAARG